MSGIESPSPDDPGAAKRMVLSITAASLIVVALGVLLVRLPFQWTHGPLYLKIFVATQLMNLMSLAFWNPELIARRIFPGKGTKRWDMVWGFLVGPVMISVFLVAGLTGREVAEGMLGADWWIGCAMLVAGWALIAWSMAVNPFFEKTVRIQTNHGHYPVERGPYRFIRHPGYIGFSLWMVATPLMLASNWALVPAGLSVLGFVVRTALEDRMLQRELPGYDLYAGRTRFRLVPGVW